MPRYLVETLYRTPSGQANAHSCEVNAADEDEAIEFAQKRCRHECRVGLIDGGDVTLIDPVPDLKLSREVYKSLAALLNMRLGTYSETAATLEAGEPFDPRRTVKSPGWFALRIVNAITMGA